MATVIEPRLLSRDQYRQVVDGLDSYTLQQKDYTKRLGDTLNPMLGALLQARPSDPATYMIEWIQMHQQLQDCGFSREGYRSMDKALLSGAIKEKFTAVPCPTGLGNKEPAVKGGFQDFVAANPQLSEQLFNKIKKCPHCGKPCAVTMAACNNCLTDLTTTEVSTSPNLFMAFIFGVDKAGFPLKISMRKEDASFMVFDDPLAMTRAHILSVPTTVFCPDIRYLFANPAAGLELLRQMDNNAWSAMETCFLADERFCREALSPAVRGLSKADFRPHVIAAFNLPPSQYQLHLQYMLPPLLPNHLGVLMKGAHFAQGRHFPLAYVRKALEAFVASGRNLPNVEHITAADLIEAVKQQGVDYIVAYKEDMDKLKKSNALLANFSAKDFEYAIVDGTVCNLKAEMVPGAPSQKDLDNQDKMVLQNYGRPYSEEEKPGGVYYGFPREPRPLGRV